jgi:hypothetical protein
LLAVLRRHQTQTGPSARFFYAASMVGRAREPHAWANHPAMRKHIAAAVTAPLENNPPKHNLPGSAALIAA